MTQHNHQPGPDWWRGSLLPLGPEITHKSPISNNLDPIKSPDRIGAFIYVSTQVTIVKSL